MRPFSYRRTKASRTARDSPSSSVKRSRSQSQRRAQAAQLASGCDRRTSSFHSQVRRRNSSRPDCLAAGAFLAQHALHLQLGGDAGVVAAGHPQRGPPLHAVVADHQVLHGHEDGVAQVQLAGHVGRRHGDDERLGVRRGDLRLEVPDFPTSRRGLPPRPAGRRLWPSRTCLAGI